MLNGFVPKSRILLAVALLAAVAVWLSISGMTSAQATVNWGDIHQTMDGFGASSADFLAPLSQDQADFFFSPTGIGFSILRIQIIPDRATCDAAFKKGGCSASNGQILNGELQSAKLAIARGAIVIATPWSPPGNYKSNGTFKDGGELLPAHYADWANEIAQFVVMMARNGVPIYAVSVQNEPDLRTDYGSSVFTAQQIHDFVPYLYAALQQAGAGSTKIVIAEQSSWNFDLASLALADPKVAPDVDIVAAHAYSGSIGPYPTAGRRLWQTEYGSQGGAYDGSMTDGIRNARIIHRFLSEASVNAWIWWFLSNMPNQGEGLDNSALTDIRGHIPKRAYVTGQWSKFVRPGWVRIGVSNSGSVEITAFKDLRSQNFAIVVVNPTRLPVTTTFSLNGFTADTLAPWITSSRWSLAAQPPVAVNGSRFRYTLPAMSVTTFTGAAGKAHWPAT